MKVTMHTVGASMLAILAPRILALALELLILRLPFSSILAYASAFNTKC